jgi:hypothetical protein
VYAQAADTINGTCVYFAGFANCVDYFETNGFNNGVSFCSFSATIKIAVGTWYHIALVYKENLGNIFINGASNSSSMLENSSQINTFILNNCLNWMLKADVGNVHLDDVKLFNKALSKEQVQRDMNGGDMMC